MVDTAAGHFRVDVPARSTLAARLTKRAIDVCVAGSVLLLSSPLLLLIGLLVRLTSPGPALFRQTRIGNGCRPFKMFKYRTMDLENDDSVHRSFVASQLSGGCDVTAGGGGFKLSHDPRITWVGALLRRTSLDELPQLINVLRGEMSLVGPRPCLPWEMELIGSHDLVRFEVLPGITGLWQVSGRGNLSMRDALILDADYVHRRSTALDLTILIKTIPVVLSLRGAG
jgi:lipopolysaccharide/colanic/teichoic acid biosynthesis glycosyltransferase